MGFWPYFFKHWNFDVTLGKTGFLAVFLYTFEFLSYPFKDGYSDIIISSIGIQGLFLKTLEFVGCRSTANIWMLSKHLDAGPFFNEHWNSDLLRSNIRLLVLFFLTLEFLFYPFTRWNCGPIFINIGTLALCFQTLQFPSYFCFKIWILALCLCTLEFWPHPSKQWNPVAIVIIIAILNLFFHCNHWNSDLILQNFAILALSFYTFKSFSYPFEHWNSGPILLHAGIWILSFRTLDFYFWKHWNSGPFLSTLEYLSNPSTLWSSGPILMRIGFLICPFETLGFWLYFYKHWNYDLMPANIGILALFYKHWNSDLILIYWSFGSIGRLISSFQRLEFSMIVIPALFFQTLEFLSYYSTANIEILAPSFETVWIVFFF